MTDETFTEPTDAGEEWADVRMTDPAAAEWEVDAVVAEGQVEYVDLRIRPDLLADFVTCLVEDVGQDRAGRVLAAAAERRGVDLGDHQQESEEPNDGGADEAEEHSDGDEASESEG